MIADKDKMISTLAAFETELLVKNEDLKSQVYSTGRSRSLSATATP